jgi:hypothetical protein
MFLLKEKYYQNFEDRTRDGGKVMTTIVQDFYDLLKQPEYSNDVCQSRKKLNNGLYEFFKKLMKTSKWMRRNKNSSGKMVNDEGYRKAK